MSLNNTQKWAIRGLVREGKDLSEIKKVIAGKPVAEIEQFVVEIVKDIQNDNTAVAVEKDWVPHVQYAIGKLVKDGMSEEDANTIVIEAVSRISENTVAEPKAIMDEINASQGNSRKLLKTKTNNGASTGFTAMTQTASRIGDNPNVERAEQKGVFKIKK